MFSDLWISPLAMRIHRRPLLVSLLGEIFIYRDVFISPLCNVVVFVSVFNVAPRHSAPTSSQLLPPRSPLLRLVRPHREPGPVWRLHQDWGLRGSVPVTGRRLLYILTDLLLNYLTLLLSHCAAHLLVLAGAVTSRN